MNGWIRIGIVLSALWVLTVAIYGGYEYHTYPLNPELHCKSWDDDCKTELYNKKFYFIEKVTEPQRKILSQWQIDNANKLLAEKKVNEEDLNTFFNQLVSWHSLNSFFYLTLIVPILVCWVIAFITLRLVIWISKGFDAKGSR